jgi:hypothetical protein
MTDFTNGQFDGNLQRIDHLVAAAARLRNLDAGASVQADDVLRAAVVFMHSTLEEVLRSLFLSRLPNASAETLNRIPFAAHDPSHRPKAIQLGELKNFTGLYVDNVIRHSISRYVDSLNVNNSEQLIGLLQLAGIRTAGLDEHMGDLNELMKRRHKIAHQMDRDSDYDPAEAPSINIDDTLVARWKTALVGFMSSLTAQLDLEPNSTTNLFTDTAQG